MRKGTQTGGGGGGFTVYSVIDEKIRKGRSESLVPLFWGSKAEESGVFKRRYSQEGYSREPGKTTTQLSEKRWLCLQESMKIPTGRDPGEPPGYCRTKLEDGHDLTSRLTVSPQESRWHGCPRMVRRNRSVEGPEIDPHDTVD